MKRSPAKPKPARDLREDAFLEDPSETTDIGGIRLRPMTLTTLMLMQRAQIGLMFGEKVTGEEQFFQISAFAWLLSDPPKTILKAFREKRWREAVEEFGLTIPVTSLPQLLVQMEAIGQSVSAGLVDVLPDEDSGEDDTPGE